MSLAPYTHTAPLRNPVQTVRRRFLSSRRTPRKVQFQLTKMARPGELSGDGNCSLCLLKREKIRGTLNAFFVQSDKKRTTVYGYFCHCALREGPGRHASVRSRKMWNKTKSNDRFAYRSRTANSSQFRRKGYFFVLLLSFLKLLPFPMGSCCTLPHPFLCPRKVS